MMPAELYRIDPADSAKRHEIEQCRRYFEGRPRVICDETGAIYRISREGIELVHKPAPSLWQRFRAWLKSLEVNQ
jgi:hypothetical protein